MFPHNSQTDPRQGMLRSGCLHGVTHPWPVPGQAWGPKAVQRPLWHFFQQMCWAVRSSWAESTLHLVESEVWFWVGTGRGDSSQSRGANMGCGLKAVPCW